jgi:predicted aspartyl protease
MSQIRVNVNLSYKGRSTSAIALFDSGAETYAFVDTSIAKKLGLPQGEAQGYSGIAGSDVGFKSAVDSLSLSENPTCAVTGSVPVLVGTVTVPNVTMLIGEYFIKNTGMVTDFSTGQMVTRCHGGPSIAVSQPVPIEYWLLGGAALAALIAAFVFLVKD